METLNDNYFGTGVIVHKRSKDTENFFRYTAPFILINLTSSRNYPFFFSLNKFNLMSISFKNHGYRDKKRSLLKFAKDKAIQHNIDFKQISFMSIPSFLGYSFNPISFFLFLDEASKINAVIYEVKNTFGDQVHYLNLYNQKKKKFQKKMYVSPFIEMDSRYEITSSKVREKFICIIDQFDMKDNYIFHASLNISLKKQKFFNFFLFMLFNIFGSFKIIFLIHYQAIKLFLKKSSLYKYLKNSKDHLYLD